MPESVRIGFPGPFGGTEYRWVRPEEGFGLVAEEIDIKFAGPINDVIGRLEAASNQLLEASCHQRRDCSCDRDSPTRTVVAGWRVMTDAERVTAEPWIERQKALAKEQQRALSEQEYKQYLQLRAKYGDTNEASPPRASSGSQ
jgi:hypothetical protein